MSLTLDRYLFKIRKRIVLENVKKLCTQFSPDVEEVEKPHIPVMLEEVIKTLNLEEGNMFLDMTFGAGGHSSALLERTPKLKVFALDRDPVANNYAIKLKEKYKNQITPMLGKFSDLPTWFTKLGVKNSSIDGVLFDLGCSSMQFDTAERGFSISRNGPLNMRMDGSQKSNHITAADVLSSASQNELYNIFKKYGEEPHAAKLAAELVNLRQNFKPITTTFELSDFVSVVLKEKERKDKLNRKTHSATKVFQALRIFVNNELNELNYGLQVVHKYLKPGRPAVVISFHSLEDRIVKKHFNNKANENSIFENLPKDVKFSIKDDQIIFNANLWASIYDKPLVPTEEEINSNPRSRSAKLRAAIALKEEEEDFYHLNENN